MSLAATVATPADEAAVAAEVLAAARAGVPLAVEGAGSKRAMLRPVQAARTLSTRRLTGITLYRPTELVISAMAGTPLAEIEAVLDAQGQMLAPEPPEPGALLGGDAPATIGGTVAANLSGPRRISAGAVRDHLLGIRFVNGEGEVVRSGGRVLKNVTGLDLCKLLAGSHGTLGIITEVTMKVLPRPEAQATLAVAVPDLAAGVAVLSAGLGSPYGVSGAALVPDGRALGYGAYPVALLRIEDFSTSVSYRIGRLAGELPRHDGSALIEDATSAALWRAVRDAALLGAQPDEGIWRVSVRPSAGPGVAAAVAAAGGRVLLDWGGGLVWVAGPGEAALHDAVVRAAAAARGSFALMRAPDPLRAAVAVMPEEPAALAAIAMRVKLALDPAGIFNPGRMRAGS